MRKRKIILLTKLLMLSWLVISLQANAQVFSPDAVGTQSQYVFIKFGMEPELVTTLGYTQVVARKADVNWSVGSSIKFAPLLLGNGAMRVNLIQSADWSLKNNWQAVISNQFYLAHNKNRAGTMNGLGFDLRAMPLHHGEKLTKGFEIGWQYTALVHIKHSDETRDTYNDRYPSGVNAGGPRDGWYSASASRLRLGFTASKTLNERLALQFGIGGLFNIQKQGILLGFSHAQVPLYVSTQLSYGL